MRFVLALIVAVAGGAPSPALPSDRGVPPSPSFVDGRFVAVADPISGFSEMGGTTEILGHVVLDVTPDGTPEEQAARLSERLGVSVTPMVMYEMYGRPEDEPLFAEQWGLENTGQTGGVPDADIDARQAWEWSLGTGAVIAVVDSGADRAHPDLTGRMWVNPAEVADNGVDDDGNGFVDDTSGWDFVAGDGDPEDTVGHGTSVASVAAAAHNDVGMAGVAPGARVMAVKACGTFGCQAGDVAQGIVYAVDNGADVVNLSLGAPGEEPLVAAAVEYAADHGVLVVAAAGNGGVEITDSNPWTPVSIDTPTLIGVASTTASDTLAPTSNHGSEVVDLAAPGEQILTAALEGGHLTRSGTSFAAPHVAGVAAQMIALDPDIGAAEIALLLASTTDQLPSLDGIVGSGGRLDAATAAQAARFRDIPTTTFASDIMWAAVSNVTKGCTATLFCPEEVVTRGQMAAFLARARGLAPTGADWFDDDDGSMFEAEIDAIRTAGITAGCTPTAFCPDDPVTRGQMAAFLVRAFDVPSSPIDWFDDDAGSIFEDDIDAIASAGITNGCSPSEFCPDAGVTRGQMVAFLHRAQPD